MTEYQVIFPATLELPQVIDGNGTPVSDAAVISIEFPIKSLPTASGDKNYIDGTPTATVIFSNGRIVRNVPVVFK